MTIRLRYLRPGSRGSEGQEITLRYLPLDCVVWYICSHAWQGGDDNECIARRWLLEHCHGRAFLGAFCCMESEVLGVFIKVVSNGRVICTIGATSVFCRSYSKNNSHSFHPIIVCHRTFPCLEHNPPSWHSGIPPTAVRWSAIAKPRAYVTLCFLMLQQSQTERVLISDSAFSNRPRGPFYHPCNFTQNFPKLTLIDFNKPGELMLRPDCELVRC